MNQQKADREAVTPMRARGERESPKEMGEARLGRASYPALGIGVRKEAHTVQDLARNEREIAWFGGASYQEGCKGGREWIEADDSGATLKE